MFQVPGDSFLVEHSKAFISSVDLLSANKLFTYKSILESAILLLVTVAKEVILIF